LLNVPQRRRCARLGARGTGSPGTRPIRLSVILGGVTTPVWYANPDGLGGAVVASPGLLVNVNSGVTYTVQQQGINLMAREFNIASGGTVQSAWHRSDVRALGIFSSTMNVQGTFTAMPGWQVPGTFGTGTTFATRGSGGVVLSRGGNPAINVDGGTLS
jgi:hypothetical protein